MLFRMEKRLIFNFVFKEKYVEFMDEYVSLNYMSRRSAQLTNNSFFLPHHGVFKANAAAPKIRVVFNGSAKATNGAPSNDVLHSGQNLLPD